MNQPARGYSWEPFQPGHTKSLVHGSESPRAINARAVEVHAELLRYAPYLDEPRFLPAVNRYLQAAARESLLHDFIMTTCDTKGPGAVPSRTWEQATAASRLSAKLGSDLGLDVIGHARIRALSVDAEVGQASLADLIERGRLIREKKRNAELAAKANENDAGE